ncbi:MAG: pilin [Patescibacteria group bacterium]
MKIKNIFNNLKFPVIFFIFFIIILVIPNLVAAQEGLISGKFFQETSIANWLKAAYLFGMGIIGVLAVAVIIFAGIQYTTSIGNPEAITQARTKIAAGIAGLLIILLSYTILHTLDPRLVKLGFEVEKLNLVKADIKELQMNVPIKKLSAKTIEEAQSQCQTYCKDKGGTPTVTPTFDTNNPFDCECTGATQKPPPCSKAEDCKKLCAGQEDKEPCKDVVFYCIDTKCSLGKKNVDAQGNLIGKDDGKDCKNDQECKSGVCLDYYLKGKICGKPLPEGARCKENNECESNVCAVWGFNECAPSGGLPFDSACDDDSECASKNCVEEGINECARIGGNLEGEDCDGKSDCKANVQLFCDISGSCKCTSGTKWDSKEQKCK